jgi:hypothetical protein
MKRRILLVTSSLLVLLGALGTGVWLYLTLDDRPTRRLADGTRLSLEGVGYNRPVISQAGPVWKRRLYPLLPNSLRPGLGLETVNYGVKKNCLAVSLLASGPKASQPYGTLTDSHGCRFWSEDNYPDQAPGVYVDTVFFPFFPRREPEFEFAACLSTAPPFLPVAQFRLSNPVPGKYPEWSPEPLPAIKRSGPLAVELVRWSAGRGETEGRPAGADERAQCFLTYRLREDGRVTRDWRLMRMTLSDAAGGSWKYSPFDFRSPAGGTLGWFASLCRRESAYRLSLEWSRHERRWAEPDGEWRVAGKLDGPAYQHHRTRFGPGLAAEWVAFPPENGRLNLLGGIVPPRRGHWFRVRARDEQGREYVARPGAYGSQSPLTQPFEVTLPAGVRRFTLIVSMYRSHTVRFQVRPTWL